MIKRDNMIDVLGLVEERGFGRRARRASELISTRPQQKNMTARFLSPLSLIFFACVS